MNTALNTIVVHIEENVDEETFRDLERGMRSERSVVSFSRSPGHNHLMVVTYDAAAAEASSLLHNFDDRGLHAQLIGM
ncbi:MAG TPA: hypothetical protein VKC56_12965 [Gallionellaceae bacterium]|nr:hypothetical protein [Gallionellaceae bacterium]